MADYQSKGFTIGTTSQTVLATGVPFGHIELLNKGTTNLTIIIGSSTDFAVDGIPLPAASGGIATAYLIPEPTQAAIKVISDAAGGNLVVVAVQ